MTLLFVFGPPAVGKMTVRRALADASSFRLFHNHHVIEPLLEAFEFETSQFQMLLGEFRQPLPEEAAAADVDLVFTLVWALDLTDDAEAVRRHLAPFVEAGRQVALVELHAGLGTRLRRTTSSRCTPTYGSTTPTGPPRTSPPRFWPGSHGQAADRTRAGDRLACCGDLRRRRLPPAPGHPYLGRARPGRRRQGAGRPRRPRQPAAGRDRPGWRPDAADEPAHQVHGSLRARTARGRRAARPGR